MKELAFLPLGIAVANILWGMLFDKQTAVLVGIGFTLVSIAMNLDKRE